MRRHQLFKFSISKIIIGFTCLAFAYLYKVIVLFIAVMGDGQCLHNYWLGNDKYFNPFSITVLCVGLFFVFGIIKFFLSIKHVKSNKGSVIFYSFFCIVIAIWLNAMYGMWQTFEYEKGNLSASQYYPDSMLQQALWVLQGEKIHECASGN